MKKLVCLLLALIMVLALLASCGKVDDATDTDTDTEKQKQCLQSHNNGCGNSGGGKYLSHYAKAIPPCSEPIHKFLHSAAKAA